MSSDSGIGLTGGDAGDEVSEILRAARELPAMRAGTAPRRGRPARPRPSRAYIAAINKHHYARAWRLGGRNSSVDDGVIVRSHIEQVS